jgi:hypothetical protein
MDTTSVEIVPNAIAEERKEPPLIMEVLLPPKVVPIFAVKRVMPSDGGGSLMQFMANLKKKAERKEDVPSIP